MKKIIMIIISFIVFAINFSPHIVFAKIQTISATSEYIMCDGENKIDSQKKVQELAIRNAVEQVGVYVESYSKTENFQLKQDEVSTISASIIKINNSEFIWKMQNNGIFVVTCNLSITMDDSNLDEIIKHGVDNKKKEEENQRLRKESEKNQVKINDLEAKVQELKTATAMGSSTNPISLAWYDRGLNCEKEKDWNGAIANYEKALLNDDKFILCYIRESYCYTVMSKMKFSDEALYRALKINDNFPEVYYALGQNAFFEDEFKKGLEYLEKARNLGFNTGKMYCYTGACYRELGDYDKAFYYLVKSCDMDKNEPLAVYELARYYDTMKDYDNAKYYFKRAYEIDDSYTYYWYYIGYLCMKNGKYSEAINNFQLYIDKETRIEELYSSELSSLLEECRQRIAKCQQYLNV